jgi:hypothetical protein
MLVGGSDKGRVIRNVHSGLQGFLSLRYFAAIALILQLLKHFESL